MESIMQIINNLATYHKKLYLAKVTTFYFRKEKQYFNSF